jgi:hypothetical protein
MAIPAHDILRNDWQGPAWIEAVEDLQQARVRIRELSARNPGEYIVFSQISQEIISLGESREPCERSS